MRLFLMIISISLCASEERQKNIQHVYQVNCIEDQHVVSAFRAAFDAFSIDFYKKAAPRSNYLITISTHSVWITLAAIAEGADHQTQAELFRLLYLPQNPCSRQKFYRIATTRVSSTNKGVIDTRALVLDQNVQINPSWYEFVRQQSLLQVFTAPIKQDPATASEIIKQIISSKHGLDLNGNSVILNSMDYNGLWTTAFGGAKVERSPFYSKKGHQIGSVDLMRMRKRARIGYAASTNLKILELPVGINAEYRMLFGLVVSEDADVRPTLPKLSNFTMSELVASLRDTYLPIEVAIPRFVISSETDVKQILLDMGVKNLWQNPETTRHISNPPALPSSYIQRATMTFSNQGIHPPPPEYPPIQHSTEEEKYWNEFVANRPFMFGLFDAETYTCLMATMFTKPTYDN